MTRDELRENVARAIYYEWLKHNNSDATWQELKEMCNRNGYQEAKRIYSLAILEAGAAIDTIFSALKEPTEEMGKAWSEVSGIDYREDWTTMLSASPLAPIKEWK